jgi:transposase
MIPHASSQLQIKNQLQHIAMNQGIRKKKSLCSESGRQLLLDLKLDPWTARRRGDLLELLDTLDQHCQKLETAVRQAAEQNADARLLMLHPGIGPVISLAFVLTIGDVSRFDTSRQVVSYLGLNPAEYSSGERRRLGRISKQGSVFMRTLLIQGAQTTVRGDEALARQYRRLAAKKNRATAKGHGCTQTRSSHVLDTEDQSAVSRGGSYAGQLESFRGEHHRAFV